MFDLQYSSNLSFQFSGTRISKSVFQLLEWLSVFTRSLPIYAETRKCSEATKQTCCANVSMAHSLFISLNPCMIWNYLHVRPDSFLFCPTIVFFGSSPSTNSANSSCTLFTIVLFISKDWKEDWRNPRIWSVIIWNMLDISWSTIPFCKIFGTAYCKLLVLASAIWHSA
jgi:hypothetical protein